MNRRVFFKEVRGHLKLLKLSQAQVDGFNILLDEGVKRDLPTSWIAYVLATAWHETAYTMQPVTEYGSKAYLTGKTYWPFIGRGYVQLTWDYNYIKMGKFLDLDLKGNPELANDPSIAAQVIYEGMERGMFTGKRLKRYLKSPTCQHSSYKQARRIVNGMDKASTIATYALKFQEALLSAMNAPKEVVIKAPKVTPKAPKKSAWWIRLIVAIFKAIFQLNKSRS